MKLKSPRFMLVSGLTLALPLSTGLLATAAGTGLPKAIRIAQAPIDLNSTPVPISPTPNPTWSPTPLNATPPNPTLLSPTPLSPTPIPSTTSSTPDLSQPPVVTAPMPLGTKPNLAPTTKPPLGFHYGEQDKYDQRINPPPKPPSTAPYPANPAPVHPPGTIAVPVYPVPTSVGDPNVAPNFGDATAVPAGVDRFGYAPPPGTLGQTYKRRSALLDDNKHPRVGIVEVHLPEDVDVTAAGLKSKWTGKVWRLESDALVPGIPHIYEVKASWGEGTQPQVRVVRLIMGRVVDLEF